MARQRRRRHLQSGGLRPEELKSGHGALARARESSRRHRTKNRAFGAYKFSASDGTETFPVAFGMVEGWPWPHRCDPTKYKRLHATVRFRDTDVAVASYPKTGTTWVEQIVLLLLHGADAKLDPASRNTYNARRNPLGCVWLEPMVASARRARMSLNQFDDLPAPRVLKIHAPFDAFRDAWSKRTTRRWRI